MMIKFVQKLELFDLGHFSITFSVHNTCFVLINSFHNFQPLLSHFVTFSRWYLFCVINLFHIFQWRSWSRRDHDRMVVGFTTTCAISA